MSTQHKLVGRTLKENGEAYADEEYEKEAGLGILRDSLEHLGGLGHLWQAWASVARLRYLGSLGKRQAWASDTSQAWASDASQAWATDASQAWATDAS
ncbi:hypothetical protein H6P81_015452 [Aristolochia fimbriata]|uniref:Uncharacterized protein n=1 Tax=Aristolochia fimbriata TaxID=158543 RepID=A0AAV7E5R0_ARIFI|nr:hypothetical protein H6P81_015452 [Aristolochia fimbriata]